MRFNSIKLPKLMQLIMLGVISILLANPAFAQSTASDLKVVVVDANGSPLAGVQVRITHTANQRSQVLTSNQAGVVLARGLQVGGPYSIESANREQYDSRAEGDIYLTLGETAVAELEVTPVTSASILEEVIVVASQMQQELRYGSGNDFNQRTIESIPSISRDFISTLATDPKILVDNSVARGPAVSIAGSNYRYNNLTIDGVAQNDNFGLSKNASATQRSPVSIDAIEALNVNIAPYDVIYGNFIGGNINVVTKSGTNEFHGSIYGFTTQDGWSGNKSDGEDLQIGVFDEDYYGGTIGGPIIKDRLFFFAAYEKYKTTRPSNTQTIDNIAGVSQADIDEVIDIFKTEYGFDPGTFAASDQDEDEKILLKVDWFINDFHRAVGSYQKAEGDVLFDDFPELAILQSNRYNINEKLEAYSLQVFSDWTNNFSTEFKYGSKDVENRQISVDSNHPDFAIITDSGGFIGAGGDRFRHTNELDNESRQIKLKGHYWIGDHTITGGWEQEKHTVRNLFLPFSHAQYTFFGADALRNREVGFVLYGNSNTGVDKFAEANFSLTIDSFYLQDEWAATDDLSLKFGVRYDSYSNNDDIPNNPAFAARNGFSNTENLDGKDLFSPRFGFNWAPSDRLTVRGGVGLFGGGTPLIMLSNSYSGNSITRTFAAFLAPFFGPPVSDSIDDALANLPDNDTAFDNFQQYIGADPLGSVDAIHPDFEIMSTWKYSLGVDYLANLGFLGDDWMLSAEVIVNDVKNAYDIYEGTRTVVGTAPDGRPVYDLPPTGGDYIVRNTSRGGGEIYTFNVAKSWDANSGLYDMTLGYTIQNLEEIRSYNRFVGFETFTMDPQTDLNNPIIGNSRYETPHRVTATFNWQKELFGDNLTTLSFVYIGRSGLRFSHVFGSGGVPTYGGHFLADFGSEADNPGSQLFYVPTGLNDPIIAGDPAFLANLDSYIDGEKCLNKYRGQIVPRNACKSAWSNIFNMRFIQEIGVWGDNKFEFILDIENLGNLINSDWGRLESYTAPSNVAPALVIISGDGSLYGLSPTTGDVVSPDTVVAQPAIARLASVYRIQLGLRFRF